MNEDFVPFELAVKLKDKGFKEKCLAYYDVEDNVGLLYNTQYTNEVLPCQYTDLLQCHNIGEAESLIDDSGFCIDAPTISQVLKWLREEKKIYIVIAVNPTLSTKDKIAYYYQVYSNSNGVTSDYYESEECYAQWEDCAIDSIKYVLDNLI